MRKERRNGWPGVALAILLAAAAAQTSSAASAIVLNQVGFQPSGPKRAVLRTEARSPLEWQLLDARGTVRAQGNTIVLGINAGSGEHVHVLDFSEFGQSGEGYRLAAGGKRSRPFRISADLYSRLKYDALGYFYHNRSGIPIEARYVQHRKWARPAGHVRDVATCFNQKDQRGRAWPGCDYRLDATGGWYDAGDHGKYVVNAGISVWTLLNYYERAGDHREAFADGRVSIPESGNGVNDLLDEVRWELRFLLGMQIPDGRKMHLPTPAGEFEEADVSGLVHHKLHDENWTGLPLAPHEDSQTRYLYPPSVTATLNLAANAAQCARIWKSIDPDFSARCLDSAKRAFAAAKRYPNLLPYGEFTGGGGYGDSDASDEFYWAAAELFISTGESQYLNAMRDSGRYLAVPEASGRGEISWQSVAALGTISLLLVPNELPPEDLNQARTSLLAAADRYLQQASGEGYVIPFSADRYEWGSNATLLNHALLLGVAYDLTRDRRYRAAMVDAMDYLLGRNPLDQSYISGYGARAMRNPHHRFWAHSLDATYPPPPPGAVSGGPNSSNMSDPVARRMRGTCRPQTCWRDDVHAFSLNEVAINWNAPLVWVVAFLDEPEEGA